MLYLKNKTITKLTCSTAIFKMQKRDYPSGTNFMGQFGKQCIGAGCNSTRPFLPPSEITSNTPVVATNPFPQETPIVPSSGTSLIPYVEPKTALVPYNTNKPCSLIPYTRKPITPLTDSVAHITKVPESSANNNNLSIHKWVFIPYQKPTNSNNTAVSSVTSQELPSSTIPETSVSVTNTTTDSKKHPLVTKENKTYTTDITQETSVTSISEEDLLLEMKKRALTNDDSKSPLVYVETIDNKVITLNRSKNKVKLSQTGQAYYERQENNNFISGTTNSITSETTNSTIAETKPNCSESDHIILKIATPPVDDEHTFIHVGKQKHLIIVVDQDNKAQAIGYLTSKTSGQFLSEEQYLAFAKKQEKQKENNATIPVPNNKEKQEENDANTQVPKNKKTQYYLAFESPQEININKIHTTKYSEEYLGSLSKDELENLTKVAKELKKKPSIMFKETGLSKEEALQMIKDFDNNFLNSKKHPKSADEIKMQALGKKKQQEKQKEKQQEQEQEQQQLIINNSLQNNNDSET